MKKTLLIAAAALAAGVISTQAQVYSQNIVGYVNTAIPGNNGLTLINNPLLGPNGTNGASQVLTGFVGGETLFVWNNLGYYQYSYAGPGVGTGLGYPSDWYDLNPGTPAAIPGSVHDTANDVWWTPAPQIPQGQGVFVQNPGSTLTNTFVGNVVIQNTNAPVALPGNNALTLVGSTLPIGGDITTTNWNLPFVGGETVFIWNNLGYYQYSYAGPGVGTGLGYPSDWYDLNPGTPAAIPGTVHDTANDVWWTPPLTVKVGQGFFVQNPGSTLQWKQNLNP